MIFIAVKLTIKADQADDFLSLIGPYTAATRAEPGNVFFEWSKSVDVPNQFVLLEAFASPEAGEAHVSTDHFKEVIAWFPKVLAASPQIIHTEAPGDGWGEMAEIAVE